jgi:hypothetical protein
VHGHISQPRYDGVDRATDLLGHTHSGCFRTVGLVWSTLDTEDRLHARFMGTGGNVFVEVKVVGEAALTANREVPGTSGSTTLRALLSGLVTDEVAAYSTRRSDQKLLRVLTDVDVAAAGSTGRVSSGGRTVPTAPPVEQAIARAMEAFTDGLVYVFLDGQQLDELDAPIVAGPASRLRLVRLVALAGG